MKTAKSVDLRAQVQEFRQTIGVFMEADQQYCIEALGLPGATVTAVTIGAVIGLNDATSATPVLTNIDPLKINGVDFKVGDYLPPSKVLQITKSYLRFINGKPTVPNVYSAELRVHLEIDAQFKDMQLGAKEFIIREPVTLTATDSGTLKIFEKCRPTSVPGGGASLEQMCTNLGGEFDAGIDNCLFRCLDNTTTTTLENYIACRLPPLPPAPTHSEGTWVPGHGPWSAPPPACSYTSPFMITETATVTFTCNHLPLINTAYQQCTDPRDGTLRDVNYTYEDGQTTQAKSVACPGVPVCNLALKNGCFPPAGLSNISFNANFFTWDCIDPTAGSGYPPDHCSYAKAAINGGCGTSLYSCTGGITANNQNILVGTWDCPGSGSGATTANCLSAICGSVSNTCALGTPSGLVTTTGIGTAWNCTNNGGVTIAPCNKACTKWYTRPSRCRAYRIVYYASNGKTYFCRPSDGADLVGGWLYISPAGGLTTDLKTVTTQTVPTVCTLSGTSTVSTTSYGPMAFTCSVNNIFKECIY